MDGGRNVGSDRSGGAGGNTRLWRHLWQQLSMKDVAVQFVEGQEKRRVHTQGKGIENPVMEIPCFGYYK